MDATLQFENCVMTTTHVFEFFLLSRISLHKMRYHLKQFCLCLQTADFGLAEIHENEVRMSLVCGTPGYCGKYLTCDCAVHFYSRNQNDY